MLIANNANVTGCNIVVVVDISCILCIINIVGILNYVSFFYLEIDGKILNYNEFYELLLQYLLEDNKVK